MTFDFRSRFLCLGGVTCFGVKLGSKHVDKSQHSEEIRKLFDNWINYQTKGGEDNESVG